MSDPTDGAAEGDTTLGGQPGPADADPLLDIEADEVAEVIEADLEVLLRERDEYLDGLRRVQAEFENYRKRIMKQQADHEQRATESLVATLLPVLDACDAAVTQRVEGVDAIAGALHDTLAKQGLVRMEADGAPFDPERHEAVVHEPADSADAAGPTVAEVLRTGYEWNGRVLRPAMVKVRG
jgi:molecular chaperone GrpE